MNTDLITTDASTSELGIEDWRFQQLVAAGWPEQQALVLAAHHDIDLHLACDLLANGLRPRPRLGDPPLSERRRARRRVASQVPAQARRVRSPRSESSRSQLGLVAQQFGQRSFGVLAPHVELDRVLYN